ncbi:flagellar biosynthetic protein FliR [[Clostridium] aminophilum]|uniref:flagellar biosynthetic protein FliR n=1 Tax=[Clostridium] aminophilum TaxID=1526 RepID=UPI0033213303
MLLLFLLIVMRMSGALAFNSLWARSEMPSLMKGMFILMLSIMMYTWIGGPTEYEVTSLVDAGILMIREMIVGFALGFGMELSFMIVRFATSIMDFSMGLNMAQIYDPQTNSQSSLTASLYVAFMMLLFFTSDAHLKFFEILFRTAETIPFGTPEISGKLISFLLKTFSDCIVMGLQFAFPIIAIELLTEVALGILMRVIPQINMFSINFQMKIIVGLAMLVFLYNPMSDMLVQIMKQMIDNLEKIAAML